MSRADRDPRRKKRPQRTGKSKYAQKRSCARKVRFSKVGAKLAADRIGDMRPYKCEFCDGWHLASTVKKRR